MPNRMTSPRFAERRNATNLRMLSLIRRPSRMAATIVLRSSSVSTISAASRAASVPLRPIATPTSARRSAGVSLMPSPVTTTTSSEAWNASTSRSFSAGVTRANTSWRAAVLRRALSSSSWSVAPVTGCASPSSSERAMAEAVTGWSPVTIATLIPAPRACATEAAASGRSGSWSPTRPTSSSSLSMSSSSGSTEPSSHRSPTARTRNPSSAQRNASSWSARRSSAVRRERSSNVSGAPLTSTRRRPSSS